MDAARKTLLLLGVLWLFGLSFELIDEGLPARDWWLFFDGYKLTPEWYWHELQDHHIYGTILLFIIAYQSKFFRSEFLIIAWLKFFDSIDFVLTNNTPWIHIGFIPLSMNIVSTSIIGMIIFRAWTQTAHLN